MARRLVVFLSAVVLATALLTSGPTAEPAATATTLPNVVLVVVDDQRADMLGRMPALQSEVLSKGLHFTNAFVTDPLCCPARTNILRGQHSHTTKIYGTTGAYGGYTKVKAFGVQDSTLATWLDDAGYRTALVGKYMNGYGPTHASQVPAGWDVWAALAASASNNADYYYNYSMSVSIDGAAPSVVKHGSAADDYSTRVFTRYALDFVTSTPDTEPLFLYLAPTAPHKPATPDPLDASAPCSVHPQGPGFGESDVSDKPAWIAKKSWSNTLAKRMRNKWVKECRSLIAVDRAIGQLVATLDAEGRLENTIFLYTSDNGILLGEHRHEGKKAAYEESIRVPLVLRYDGYLAPGIDDRLVLNTDIAPTILEAAGIAPPDPVPCLAPCIAAPLEGRSLLPPVDPNASWRADVLIEHYDAPSTNSGYVPAYCAVRTATHKYVRYDPDDEVRPEELYDLTVDPAELRNVAADPAYAEVLATLRDRLPQLCSPTPPNYTFP